MLTWTPDLGYARVDPAVLELCGDAAAEFETLGCHVEVVNPGWENPEDAFTTIVAAQFYAAWADALMVLPSQRLGAYLTRIVDLVARQPDVLRWEGGDAPGQ